MTRPDAKRSARTARRSRFAAPAISVLLALSLLAAADPPVKIGKKVPNFKLESAFGKTYTLKSFSEPVLVFYYEGRDTRWDNQWIKERLGKMLKTKKIDPKKLRLIGIVNFQEVPAPAFLVRPHVKKAAKKTPALLLMDEDGRMQKKWGFRNGRSNIYVLDKKRRLRWRTSGKLSQKRGNQLIRFVYRLAKKH